MMQMLHAGGASILRDDIRVADTNNPRGYFEYEPVKHTVADDSWVHEAPGKAVKVIHALLRVLPDAYAYRVVFMKRNLQEIVSSQAAMLEQLGEKGVDISTSLLRDAYAREYERIGAWLSAQPNFSVFEVNYNELISEPVSQAERVAAFLGGQLDTASMISAVDGSLYRQRAD